MDIAGLGRGSRTVPHAYRSCSRSERPVQPRSGSDRGVDGVLDCLAVAGKKTAASRISFRWASWRMCKVAIETFWITRS